ncbi:MAG: hypothetical protein ABFD52_00625 [Acidobacteriota bacterium]
MLNTSAMTLTEKVRLIKASLAEGGKGSGNFGHKGRPGKQGGSKAGTGGVGKGKKVETGTINTDDLTSELHRLYRGWGSEQGETMIFLKDDGTFVSISSGEANQVSLTGQELFDTLRAKKFYLSGLKAIIHNHAGKEQASGSDQKALASLRKMGFRGDYQVFDTEHDRLTTVADKNEVLLQTLKDLREEALRSAPSLDGPVPEDLIRRLRMLQARM